MSSRPWIIRFAAIALFCTPWCLAAAPSAQAGAGGAMRMSGPGHSATTAYWAGTAIGRVRAAAAVPAPLVTDSGAQRHSKRGLAAPAMSAPMAWANAQKQVQARRIMQVMTAQADPGGKCTSRKCRASMPVARDLLATQQAQIRNYFCGPATVSEMLAQMREKVGQLRAARALGTTQNGTDWSNHSGYPVPDALNKNQSRNVYVAVPLPWSPTAAQTKTYEIDLVTDINDDGGVPLAGNAYEVSGGPHLVGNPIDQTIFHWFDIRGYGYSGAVTDYEDSVHGASSVGWSDAVPAYSSMSSSTIVEILGARGYDW